MSSSSNILSKRFPFSPNAQDSSSNSRPSKRIMQHPSTTPKAPPNPEYFDFIRKGGITLRDLDSTSEFSSGTSLSRNRTTEDNSMYSNPTEKQQQSHTSLQEQEQEQEHLLQPRRDNDGDLDLNQDQDQNQIEDLAEIERLPVSSNIMAFARKSIMQHASTQPRSIFSRLNEKKSQGVKSASLASAQPPPREPKAPARASGLEKPKLKTSTSVLSRPTLSSPAPQSGNLNQALPSTASTSATPAYTPTMTPTTTLTPKSSIPLKGVLDFSGGSASTLRLEKPINNRLPMADTPPQSSTKAQLKVLSPPERLLPSTPTEPAIHGIQQEETAVKSNLVDAGQATPGAFDLRALLRQDSAKVQYNLPNLIASLSPPASPKRPSPYAIPSLKEREALRARRMPRFKARPLNPKMFTGAGDTGVPKIAKQPLTVPVSPVFSRTRIRPDLISMTAGRDKGKSNTTSRTTTASRLKDVLKTGPDRPKVSGGKNTLSNTTTTTTAAPYAQSSFLAHLSVGSQRGAGQTREHVSHLPERPRSSTPATVDPSLSARTSSTPLATPATHTNTSTRQRIQSGRPMSAQSNLRRPATSRPTMTKPTPFKFATTELQRKRVNAVNSNALTLDDLA